MLMLIMSVNSDRPDWRLIIQQGNDLQKHKKILKICCNLKQYDCLNIFVFNTGFLVVTMKLNSLSSTDLSWPQRVEINDITLTPLSQE